MASRLNSVLLMLVGLQQRACSSTLQLAILAKPWGNSKMDHRLAHHAAVEATVEVIVEAIPDLTQVVVATLTQGLTIPNHSTLRRSQAKAMERLMRMRSGGSPSNLSSSELQMSTKGGKLKKT